MTRQTVQGVIKSSDKSLDPQKESSFLFSGDGFYNYLFYFAIKGIVCGILVTQNNDGTEVKKMRKVMLMVVMVATLCLITSAFASMKTLVFPDGTQGKVTFDGKMHNAKLGPGKCSTCHPKIFPFKAPGAEGSAKITMADINGGKFCGTCHNGTTAFKASDAANCGKCHKK